MASKRSDGGGFRENGERRDNPSFSSRQSFITAATQTHSQPLLNGLSLSLSPSRFVNFDQQLRVSSSFIPGDCTFVPSCAPQPHLLLLLLLLFPFPPPNSRSFLHEAILFDGRTHDGKSGTSSLVPANAKACVSRRVEFTRAASRIFTSRAASPLPSFRSAPLFPRPPPRLRYFFFLSISLQKMRRSISLYSIRRNIWI